MTNKNTIAKIASYCLIVFFFVLGFTIKAEAYTGVQITPTAYTSTSITFSTIGNTNVYYNNNGCTKLDINGLGSAPYENIVIGTGASYSFFEPTYALTDGQHDVTIASDGCTPMSDGFEYFSYEVSGGEIISINTITNLLTTKINTTSPTNGSTIASSTSHTLNFTGYITEPDMSENATVHYHLENSNKRFDQCADVYCSIIANGSAVLDFYYPLNTNTLSLGTYGNFNYSTTTGNLPIGRYYVTIAIQSGACGFFDWLFGSCTGGQEIYATTTQFIIATTTKADKLVQSSVDFVNSLAGESDFSECNIASLNLLGCMQDIIAYAFVPTSDALQYNAEILKEAVIHKFPIGYITNIVEIIGTTTVGTLPSINLEMPQALGLGNGTLHLDPTHSLDYVLNATTTIFNNNSASSTETFGTITKRYWDIALYTLFGIYILMRLLGSHIIPKTFNQIKHV